MDEKQLLLSRQSPPPAQGHATKAHRSPGLSSDSQLRANYEILKIQYDQLKAQMDAVAVPREVQAYNQMYRQAYAFLNGLKLKKLSPIQASQLLNINQQLLGSKTVEDLLDVQQQLNDFVIIILGQKEVVAQEMPQFSPVNYYKFKAAVEREGDQQIIRDLDKIIQQIKKVQFQLKIEYSLQPKFVSAKDGILYIKKELDRVIAFLL